MKKTLWIILFCMSLLIIVALIVLSQSGIVKKKQLETELSELVASNKKLEEENRALQEEILLLKNNMKYIEELARKELGLVKKGEVVYQLKKEKGPNN